MTIAQCILVLTVLAGDKFQFNEMADMELPYRVCYFMERDRIKCWTEGNSFLDRLCSFGSSKEDKC